ncbi:MAG TPA: hypothetical protein VE988_04695 [Gemmataceae bacterium]|nr:hypothetical protein [Gemmataceae bacterium]
MRTLLFSLVTAVTLIGGAVGCSHATKWHEGGNCPTCGQSQPMVINQGPVAQPMPISQTMPIGQPMVMPK